MNCSFCVKDKSDVKILIEGLEAYICDECVLDSLDLLIEYTKNGTDGILGRLKK